MVLWPIIQTLGIFVEQNAPSIAHHTSREGTAAKAVRLDLWGQWMRCSAIDTPPPPLSLGGAISFPGTASQRSTQNKSGLYMTSLAT